MQKEYSRAGALVLAVAVFAPQSLLAQRVRVTSTIDNSRRITLAGHMHPAAVDANDQGRVDASLQLSYVTMALQPSAAQQADLTALLERQQDPSSADYHHWLTPEQYADRFGVAPADIDKISSWLGTQQLTVLSVARGRNAISFRGPVRAVESAFGTEVHHYLVNGELHFANAGNPSIPAALFGVVLGIHGLNDFKLKPAIKKLSPLARPKYYSDSACGGYCIAPSDFATIYDINPLYKNGINGAGQKLVIVGQTEINPLDIANFRSTFGLPVNAPSMIQVPNDAPIPTYSNTDIPEADLDLELSGAVAQEATIFFVYSNNVEDSVEYAIDQNLAPVVSMSYGQCEEPVSADLGQTSADAQTLRTYAQQANSQGITWLAAAGDSGGADCYGESGVPSSVIDSPTVDYPGSIPEVTSVGGLQFNEGSGTYWGSSGGALFYMPEIVWNTSTLDGEPAAGGGGASVYFAKPSWQVANGVPSDGARDVPDVSLSASDDHDPFVVYSSTYSNKTSSFGASTAEAYGGTSAGAPSMAGIVTLLNQYLVQNGYQSQSGVGNINPRLYALQSAGVFHDITTGNNIVDPCQGSSRRSVCANIAVGFDAGPGYDQASGLGSMDVNSMVLAWQPGAVSKSSTTLALTSSLSSLTSGGSLMLTATVTASNGGTPTGSVTFYSGGVALGSAQVAGSVATLTVSGAQLTIGTDSISAQYGGDASHGGSAGTITVSVTAASAVMSISGVTNAASFQQVYAPGMIMAVFGSNLGPAAQLAQTVPLPTSLGGVTATINGVAAPIYYVSPGQLNIQVPYGTQAGANATLTVGYNGQTASISFPVSAAAPGIFYDPATGEAVPYESASPGATITLYITGDGAESPQVTTGSTPSANIVPRPTQNVTLTVGGTQVAQPLPFVGVPGWSIGVTQINFVVPCSATPGTTQQVVVTVGNASSAAVNLSVVSPVPAGCGT